MPWSLYGLRRAWNTAKNTVAPWWAENSKEAYTTGLDGVARALRNWAASRSGTRKGPKIGLPRFKSKHRAAPSCRFTTGAIRVEADRHHVTLPRLGTIRTGESTRKLARHLERGTGRILSATVRGEGGRWFVAFTCELDRADRAPARPGAVVGVDLGVKDLAVLSTGEVVANPKHHRSALKRLRRLNKQLARRTGPRTPDGARPGRGAADVAQSRGETRNARGGAVGPGTRAGRAPAKREPRKRGTLRRKPEAA
ncbi:transposase [Streptosporangium sp. OZ121]|uniref:transposase n=1 Tax=Streptosporangium sp. OZ121 TaxID=3444183 RepID=UPI003F79339B